jgi:hypothetical protein
MAGGLAPQLVQASVKAKKRSDDPDSGGSTAARLSAISTKVRSRKSADYCESDIVNTYRVWLRYQLFRGTLSQDAFEASQQNLAATPDRCCGARPAFLAKVDELLRGEPEIGVGSVKAPAGVPGID